MRRAILRSAAAIACVAWSARSLGCDSASTAPVFVDTDKDGLSDIDETEVYGTSPVLADSDGDGMSDHDEIVVKGFDPANAPLRFNPRLADVPEMEVEIVGPPLISLNLTDAKGETVTFEVGRLQEEILTDTVSATETNGRTESVGDAVTREGAVSNDVSLNDGDDGGDSRADAGKDGGRSAGEAPPQDPGGPVMVTLTDGVSATTDRSTSTAVEVSFTEEQSRQIRQALTLVESYARRHDIVASGGTIGVLAVLRNRGNLAFRVTNLLLSAWLVSGEEVQMPIGNLDINTNNTSYQPYAIAPGAELGPLNFFKQSLTLDQAIAILGDVRGLVVRVGVYELSDATGRPYVFDVPTIKTRTATVSIDYGASRSPERHLVATNLDAAKPGVTVKRALDEILRIPFECDPDAGGLVSVRGVTADADGGKAWCLRHRREDGGDEISTSDCVDLTQVDCKDLVLRAGDVLHLSLVEP